MSLILSAERHRCRGRPEGGRLVRKGHATTLHSLVEINTKFGDGIWAAFGLEAAAAQVINHVNTLLLLLLHWRSRHMCARQAHVVWARNKVNKTLLWELILFSCIMFLPKCQLPLWWKPTGPPPSNRQREICSIKERGGATWKNPQPVYEVSQFLFVALTMLILWGTNALN